MKTVVVTGASRGIGKAVAEAFCAAGYRVTGFGSKDCDVSDSAAVARFFAQAGRVDVLVNNAGVAHRGLLQDMTDAEWRRVTGVNLDGAFFCTRAVLPDMISRKSGCIINISSVWGLCGASCEVAYSASKAGLIGFTRALAREVAPSGVRVNAIAPGAIDTDMNAGLCAAELAGLAALGRTGSPADVAALAVFLASDAASFITGQAIAVDGGFI